MFGGRGGFSDRYIWGPSPGYRENVDLEDCETEALRTQLDNLKWEVNRLDTENRRLREANQEAVVLMDLETELEQSKVEVETLKQRLKASEEHAAMVTVQTDMSEQTTTQEQLLAVQEQLAATQTELTKAQQDRTATQQELLRTQEQWQVVADELTVEQEKAGSSRICFKKAKARLELWRMKLNRCLNGFRLLVWNWSKNATSCSWSVTELSRKIGGKRAENN